MQSEVLDSVSVFNATLKRRYGKFPIAVDFNYDLVTMRYMLYCKVLDEKQFIHNFKWISERRALAGREQFCDYVVAKVRGMVLENILEYCRKVDCKK